MPPRIKKESDFMPLDERSLKHALEVPVKHIPREKIEKIEKVGTKKPSSTERKINTSKDYTLVITEKPQAAMKIADALGNSRKMSDGGIPYYEVSRKDDGKEKKIIVACAVGHLFNINQDPLSKAKGWPIFDIAWTPSYEKKGSSFTKKYYTLIKKLAKNAADFIIATDYDIEGEVIGWNIVRFICNQKDAKRMKFSSLTKPEIEQAYLQASPTIDWGQAIAGETRHSMDWLYGINLSRALMDAIKKAGSFRIMSVGRVQGPALNLVVKKEKEIQKFKSEPYWQIFIIIQDGKLKLELKYVKDITKKSELRQFELLKGKLAEVKTSSSEQKIPPLHPFDLTTLQTEAYKFHGVTPSQTLQIAQGLYLSGLISYPRTSSQKIPDSINAKEILKKLSKSFSSEIKMATRSKPVEGSKSDPAHPSIYPTGESAALAELEGTDRKVYELIARRFISCFCPDAIISNKKIEADINNLRFNTKGMQIKQAGWMDVYKSKLQEKELPDVNGKFEIKEARIEEKQTQPPKRYSPASIVSELAKRNLGTKATRANIVETLYNRGYVKERSLEATPIGISLIDTLEKHSPIIIDEKLTREFEKDMELIEKAKKDLEKKKDKILENAKKVILDIEKSFKKDILEIGKELIEATANQREQEKKDNTLSKKCPNCNEGNLQILFNRMSKRNFIACNKYPDCKTTFTLPHGLVKPIHPEKLCEACSWPRLLLIKKGKRPWEFCFNPECPSRQKKEEEIAE